MAKHSESRSKGMKVRVQQLNLTVGYISSNQQKILDALKQAEAVDVALLILPELCVCGYSPGDLLKRTAFLERVYKANKTIVEATKTTALIFGTVTANPKKQGRPCYNTALMAYGGQKVGETHKTLLPNDDVYDEARYFEPSDSIECVAWKGRLLGITICEDIWENFDRSNKVYYEKPAQKLAGQGAEAIINISASPFTVTKSESRLEMLQHCSETIKRPIVYVNQAGGNDSLVFDGDSMVLNSDGSIVARAPLFDEAFADVRWHDDGEAEPVSRAPQTGLPSRAERIYLALQQGLKDYFRKTGVTSDAIIGLSGGIDSSLAVCLAVEALGADQVTGVAMPSEFSSRESVIDAEKLAKNLGIEFQTIPIETIYNSNINALEPVFGDSKFGIAEENLQARVRGVLLMAIANKFDSFVLYAGNKSELAVGYCTLYGDTNGALAIISDLYKTEVYELSRWLNKYHYKREVIPQNILDKPPSAELSPGQKDSDSLPEYEVLDHILKLYIEQQKSIEDIAGHGIDINLAENIIKMVNRNEFKRQQVPPGIKIHDKAFGLGRRLPVVKKWNG